MMRSEEDLLAALSARERLVPDARAVRAGVARAAARVRRRRVVGSGAAGLALAAVVSVPAVLVGLGGAGILPWAQPGESPVACPETSSRPPEPPTAQATAEAQPTPEVTEDPPTEPALDPTGTTITLTIAPPDTPSAEPSTTGGTGPSAQPCPEPSDEPTPTQDRLWTDPYAADRPDTYFTLPALITLAGYEIRAWEADAGTQTAQVYPVGADLPSLHLTVFRPGADMSDFPLLDAIPNATIHGARAYVEEYTAPIGEHGISVWWEYTPGGYAILGTVFGLQSQPPVPSREELLRIAEAVYFVDPYPAATPDTVPFRLEYLPDGFGAPPTEMHFQEDREGEISLWLNWELPGDPDALDIDVSYQPVTNGDPATPITLGGRPGDCMFDADGGYGSCRLWEGEHMIFVGGTGLTLEDAELISAGLTLADFNDESTWFDLADAFPSS